MPATYAPFLSALSAMAYARKSPYMIWLNDRELCVQAVIYSQALFSYA
jgi:hypothetical protein